MAQPEADPAHLGDRPAAAADGVEREHAGARYLSEDAALAGEELPDDAQVVVAELALEADALARRRRAREVVRVEAAQEDLRRRGPVGSRLPLGLPLEPEDEVGVRLVGLEQELGIQRREGGGGSAKLSCNAACSAKSTMSADIPPRRPASRGCAIGIVAFDQGLVEGPPANTALSARWPVGELVH